MKDLMAAPEEMTFSKLVPVAWLKDDSRRAALTSPPSSVRSIPADSFSSFRFARSSIAIIRRSAASIKREQMLSALGTCPEVMVAIESLLVCHREPRPLHVPDRGRERRHADTVAQER